MAEQDTKALVKPSENYMKLLDESCGIIRKLHTAVLTHYHSLGEKVAELCSRPDKYGKKTVQMFSADLAKKGVQLGADSLYNAQQIYKHITPKQLKQAKEAGLSLRKTLLLCRKSVDDDTRQAVLDSAHEARDGNQFNVSAAIEEKTTTAAVEPKGPDIDKEAKRAAKILKSAEKLIGDLQNKLKDIGDGVEIICRGDNQERIKDAYIHFGDACLAIDSLTDVWGKQVDKANSAFKAVQSIIED